MTELDTSVSRIVHLMDVKRLGGGGCGMHKDWNACLLYECERLAVAYWKRENRKRKQEGRP